MTTTDNGTGQELKPVYVRDDEYPGVDTAVEAVEAAADKMLRLYEEVTVSGEPVRNDAKRRWEVPVASRSLPRPDCRSAVFDHGPEGWTLKGAVETDVVGEYGSGYCDCCGKRQDSLIVVETVATRVHRVGLVHAARYLDRTPQDLRLEVDALLAEGRRRFGEGKVFASRGYGGWVPHIRLEDSAGAVEVPLTNFSIHYKRDALSIGLALRDGFSLGVLSGAGAMERRAQELSAAADAQRSARGVP